MEKVQRLIDAGASVPTAIKESLSMTLVEFADKHRLPRTAISNAINGNVRASDEMIDALIKELGGEAHEWRMLLWESARPAAKAS